jgi:hypothetical protein
MIAYWFVSRRSDGAIASAHQEPEEDAAMERVAADDPEVVAFFAKAYPPRPITVSRLRLKLELADRGLLTDVGQAVHAAGAAPQIYWAEASEFESDHPLMLQIGMRLGLSSSYIREIFEAAGRRDV